MNCHLVLKEWLYEATLEEIDFSTSEIWVQVRILLVAYLTKSNALNIAIVFPKLLELDYDNSEEIMWNRVIRMKVLIDVDEPLKTRFYLKRKNKPKIQNCCHRFLLLLWKARPCC
ncbi:hypothetical protein REPUB_Repub02eG0078900 [Reevesia pubescens]